VDYLNRKKVIKHVLITGVVGDAVGAVIEQHSHTDRVKVYQKAIGLTKSTATKPIGVTPSHFGIAMLGTFNALRKRTRVSVEGINYEALLFGGSVGAGLFAAYSDLSFSELLSLVKELQLGYRIDSEDAQTFLFMAWLVQTLVHEGYLRPTHIQQAQTLQVVSPALGQVLAGISAHQFDKRYMTLRVAPSDSYAHLNPYEQTIAKTVFYLFQSFSGWNTKPRFALQNVVTHDSTVAHDLFFVFSVVCVASEHNYLLYTRPLQERNPLVQKIHTLFEHV
jgi:hypothetical protein